MILMGKESRSVLKLEGEWKQIYSTIIISVYIYRERNHVTIKTKGTLIRNLFDVFIFHGRVYNEVLLIKRNDFEQRTFILGEKKKGGGGHLARRRRVLRIQEWKLSELISYARISLQRLWSCLFARKENSKSSIWVV